MYINMIDELFDGLLDKFNNFLIKEKAFQKLVSDVNFVKYQNDIILLIKTFIDSIEKKDIITIIKNESYYESILNIIKRYCAFYIYLGIAYYYEGSRDLYVTNIIEASKYQKDSKFQIANFFNSENNAKIINFYNDIKNFLSLVEFKTIDKIKIILTNNIMKYESTIKLFNDLGEDYILEFFLIKDNFQNIMKALIFKQIYMKEEKNEIISMLNQIEQSNAEYKYIEIVLSNEKKLVDFNLIQKFVSLENLRYSMAEEIYAYLEEVRDIKEIIIKENKEFINYLFANEIIIPITEDFLRFHKDTEKYDPESLVENTNIKERDATKIKYIINKMNTIQNYYLPLLEKNPKLKLDIEKLFFKQMDPKMAVLYNNDEEVKIIQKLQISEQATDFDLLIDLENIRKYAYVNFKHFSKDGITIRPPRTIQGIRYSNIKGKKNDPIETRIGHNNIDMKIVGIAWNPSKTSLDCVTIKDLVDVRIKTAETNGYISFVKIMEQTFATKNNKSIYYWLFDNMKDKPILDKYINFNQMDSANNIKVMIGELYNVYIKMVQHKILKYVNSIKETNIWEMNNIIHAYSKKYFNLDLNKEIKNEIIEEIITNKILELPIISDDTDMMIPGKRDTIILLPSIKIKKENKNIIIIGEKEIDVSIELSKKNIPVCYHYILWNSITKMSKKTDDFNQEVFEFVKQYVDVNTQGEYICKSCKENLNIYKYVGDVVYNEDMNTFSTTSVAVTQKLEDIPKYSKYLRAIRNIEKTIEKIAFTLELSSFLGNTPVIKLKRKLIIKDVIDLILIHTEWLKLQPSNRSEIVSKKYGINKDLTNLFFFELKDDIFLTSSTDTDYYKFIKYNNIIAYIIVMLLLEMNPGQLLNLKEDKRYNYFYYNKLSGSLFNDLYLRINQKDKRPLTSLPLFSYILYYLCGMMVSNRFWLYNTTNVAEKDRPLFIINLQKTVINTVIDLINSLVEANFAEKKNFLYEIINTRINVKITNMYQDNMILSRIQTKSIQSTSFNEETKKVTFITKKINLINVDNEFNIIETLKPSCDLTVMALKKHDYKEESNNLSILTNCADGKFHSWVFKSKDLICSLCSQSYNNIIKLLENTTTEEQNFEYLDKILYINLKKLSTKYCISGEIHNIDSTGKCNLCGVNTNTFNPSNKELKQLEKNIEIKTNEVSIMMINKMKEYNMKLQENDEKYKKIINKLLKRYSDETKDKLENYIYDFVDRLSKKLGPKIKVNNKTIYLKETVYIINHDYMGNLFENKEPYTILSSDDKIKLIRNHNVFNKDVLYYKDKANNVYVYYDSITLQHLGYSEDNTTKTQNIKKSRNNVSLKIELSIKDCIAFLGYENQYFNIYHINKDFINLPSNTKPELTNDEILNIIRNRMHNLKQIIIRTQSIIYRIRNSGIITSIYNTDEKQIISEFTKKLKKFNIMNDTGHDKIFKNHTIITNKLPVNHNIPENIKFELNKNYLDLSNINILQNSDSKLIFYLIYNFNKLLDYNKQPAIEIELTHLIIRIIKSMFNFYYRPYSNFNIRKFDYLLIHETPYIDETLKGVGNYMELLTPEEINDPTRNEIKKEDEEQANEEATSLDIDDYEIDDDIDGSAEALDGYE